MHRPATHTSQQRPFSTLWAERNFRLLWMGQTLSMAGDSMIVVASALYITELTGSTRDVGIVLAAGSAALVVCVLFGGVWADRLPRNRIMIGSDLIRAAVQLALATLIAVGSPPLWAFAALVAVFGGAEAFFRPAFSGLLPQTVPEHLIQPAQAVTHTSDHVARLVGPAVATVVALNVGYEWVYAGDAVTFAVSAVLLARIEPRRRGDDTATRSRPSMRTELIAGFREVRSRAWVWVVLLMALVSVMSTLGPFQSLGASIAQREYGQIAVFGWFQVAAGAGAIAGALVAIGWRPRHPLRVGTVMIALWPAGALIYSTGGSTAAALAAGAAGGVGFSLFLVWWETALAERIPAGALSRVSSYDWMVSLAFLPIGYLVAGILGEHFRPELVLAAGAAVGLVAVLAALLSPAVRNLHRMDPAEATNRPPN